MFFFERASRQHPADSSKATLPARLTEAHRNAEHLRIDVASASDKPASKPSHRRLRGLLDARSAGPSEAAARAGRSNGAQII
jgi:hypothetical protein